MAAWDCPHCSRRFARAGQGHECSPAMAMEEYLSTGPDFEAPIVEALLTGLAAVGPVHVEPLSVGVYLKRAQMFAMLRPMARWEAVTFSLPRVAHHRLIVRKVVKEGQRHWHTANVATTADVDTALIELLTEAYLDAPPA